MVVAVRPHSAVPLPEVARARCQGVQGAVAPSLACVQKVRLYYQVDCSMTSCFCAAKGCTDGLMTFHARSFSQLQARPDVTTQVMGRSVDWLLRGQERLDSSSFSSRL